jgi:hypothetical protein
MGADTDVSDVLNFLLHSTNVLYWITANKPGKQAIAEI